MARLCRSSCHVTIFPGEDMLLQTGNEFDNQTVALEPRNDSVTYRTSGWPSCQLVGVTDGVARVTNNTSLPIRVPKNDHMCQIRATRSILVDGSSSAKPKGAVQTYSGPFSKEVIIDPSNQLSSEWRREFQDLHLSYDSVFENKIGRYNDASGKVRSRIIISNVMPPTRKLRVPNYCKNSMEKLQEKFDELEAQGVFARPEDVGVVVEHVSPSFLVAKPSGGHRLVTNFASLLDYCKTLPTIMPTVESVLRTLSSWKYIVVTDLRDAFYQIPMDKSSMKWCATPTPFRGLRVYTVAVQGLPGSSEFLEEMLCAVLGEYVKQGIVAKIADDLNVGGDTIESLYYNWMNVLDALYRNGLKLKGPKTIVAPTQTQILGWLWNNGNITAGKHKISPLVTCNPPETVTALRSFVGAYKVFNRIIRGCARLLCDLEKFMSGKQKNEKLIWTDSILQCFKSSQEALSAVSVVALPTPSDRLILVHDGSKVGIGSVLYLKQGSTMKLGGFFSARLKAHQQLWYPCEIEALSIATSVVHHGPYIVQSHHRTQILTDNRPCVQAWGKMKRGEFSSSARVGSFMSILSQYDVDVQFIKGEYNLPSDFQSRNPQTCEQRSCQICKFVDESDNIVVRKASVEAVLAGHEMVPYATRSAWKNLQLECQDLRRVHSHLRQGTRPTARKSKATVVKRFLRNVKISGDGLLVVRQSRPFLPEAELIVVPLNVLHGLLTSLHLQLGHPTATQLTNVFNRQYFSLNVNDCITHVIQSCSQCQALKTIPSELQGQTSSIQATATATNFAADVIRRYKQKIFVMRDTLSSFTITSIISDEKLDSLRSAIVEAVSSIRANPSTIVTIRIDNAPGLAALKDDLLLQRFNIMLDFGRIHNKNKNPVAEKAIRELGGEMLRYNSNGGPFSTSELAYITNMLNSRLRHHGLSAWEILHHRDQFTGEQIDFTDLQLADSQKDHRAANQDYSSLSKSKGGQLAQNAVVIPGSLVYVKADGDKTKARERYLVVKVVGDSCTVQKISKSLRSKSYQLKLSEVYPVVSDLPPIPDHVVPNSDSESDTDIHSSENFVNTDNLVNLVINNNTLPVSDTQLLSSPSNVDHNVHSNDSSFNNNVTNDSLEHNTTVSFLQPDVTMPPVDLDCTLPYAIEGHSPDHVDVVLPSRRSVRSRQEPKWKRSGDYVS